MFQRFLFLCLLCWLNPFEGVHGLCLSCPVNWCEGLIPKIPPPPNVSIDHVYIPSSSSSDCSNTNSFNSVLSLGKDPESTNLLYEYFCEYLIQANTVESVLGCPGISANRMCEEDCHQIDSLLKHDYGFDLCGLAAVPDESVCLHFINRTKFINNNTNFTRRVIEDNTTYLLSCPEVVNDNLYDSLSIELGGFLQLIPNVSLVYLDVPISSVFFDHCLALFSVVYDDIWWKAHLVVSCIYLGFFILYLKRRHLEPICARDHFMVTCGFLTTSVLSSVSTLLYTYRATAYCWMASLPSLTLIPIVLTTILYQSLRLLFLYRWSESKLTSYDSQWFAKHLYLLGIKFKITILSVVSLTGSITFVVLTQVYPELVSSIFSSGRCNWWYFSPDLVQLAHDKNIALPVHTPLWPYSPHFSSCVYCKPPVALTVTGFLFNFTFSVLSLIVLYLLRNINDQYGLLVEFVLELIVALIAEIIVLFKYSLPEIVDATRFKTENSESDIAVVSVTLFYYALPMLFVCYPVLLSYRFQYKFPSYRAARLSFMSDDGAEFQKSDLLEPLTDDIAPNRIYNEDNRAETVNDNDKRTQAPTSTASGFFQRFKTTEVYKVEIKHPDTHDSLDNKMENETKSLPYPLNLSSLSATRSVSSFTRPIFTLDHLIEQESLLKSFRTFCVELFLVEPVEFFVQINQYKKVEDKLAFGRKIFQNFLRKNAPMPIFVIAPEEKLKLAKLFDVNHVEYNLIRRKRPNADPNNNNLSQNNSSNNHINDKNEIQGNEMEEKNLLSPHKPFSLPPLSDPAPSPAPSPSPLSDPNPAAAPILTGNEFDASRVTIRQFLKKNAWSRYIKSRRYVDFIRSYKGSLPKVKISEKVPKLDCIDEEEVNPSENATDSDQLNPTHIQNFPINQSHKRDDSSKRLDPLLNQNANKSSFAHFDSAPTSPSLQDNCKPSKPLSSYYHPRTMNGFEEKNNLNVNNNNRRKLKLISDQPFRDHLQYFSPDKYNNSQSQSSYENQNNNNNNNNNFPLINEAVVMQPFRNPKNNYNNLNVNPFPVDGKAEVPPGLPNVLEVHHDNQNF